MGIIIASTSSNYTLLLLLLHGHGRWKIGHVQELEKKTPAQRTQNLKRRPYY